MTLRTPSAGLVVAEKYRLEERLGGGGMGEVYRAEHIIARRAVALKLLRSDLAEDEDLTRRFFQEAQAANRIRHPCIVDVIDAGIAETGPYIAMELLDGESIAAALARVRRVPLDAAVAIGLAVLSALDAAHLAGIIHRDLKPENVYLHRTPEQVSVKLLDFGIAKVLEPLGPTPRTHTGIVFGTPDYLSPEQATGDRILDGRSDLFAVGVLLFELVTGGRPFRATTAIATAYKVVHAAAPSLAEAGGPDSALLEAILTRAMRKRPEERYARASDFARELELVAPSPDRRAEALAWVLSAPGPGSGKVEVARTLGSPFGRTGPADALGSRLRRSASLAPVPFSLPPAAKEPLLTTKPESTPRPPASGLRTLDHEPSTHGSPPARTSIPDSARAPESGSTPATNFPSTPHVRGSVLRAIDKAIAQRHGAALRDRIVDRLPSSCVDDFRHHTITGLVLYGIDVLDGYVDAARELAGLTDTAAWREIGRASVEGDLSTLLRQLARSSDELTLVRRGVGLWSRLFAFGAWSVETDTSPFVVRVVDLMPASIALRQWLVGLVEQSIRIAGFPAAIVTPVPADLATMAELELLIDPGPRR